MRHRLPSKPPSTNTSSRPSVFRPTAGARVMGADVGWPRVAKPDQPLLGAVCQMCHSSPSVTNTSSRPSAFWPTVGLTALGPNDPREAQPDQPLLGAVCQMSHRPPLLPHTNTSSRPSAFVPTA